jgi:hypothetical protein
MNGNQIQSTQRLRGGFRFGPTDTKGGKRETSKRKHFGTTIDTNTYEEFIRISNLHNLRISEILDTLVSTGAFSAAAGKISKR